MTLAVYKINAYVWELLQRVHDWDAAEYSVVPITPDAEPEIVQLEKPYLLYGYGNEETGLLTTDQVAYTIVSKSSNEINQIIETLSNAFKRGAQSAIDINTNIDPSPFSFKTTGFAGASGPESDNTQSADWKEGIVLVRYTYGHDLDLSRYDGLISGEV